ncbi:hypothetical protein IKG60_00620 [Candidatus Saccharibacteria bacterium]|nr:hypothetical protein [Candidatus Saccharibacteria bacterium]
MDNELGKNDPYREMKQQAQNDVRPDFLKQAGNSAEPSGAQQDLGEAESAAAGGFYGRSDSAQESEEQSGGFSYTGKGKSAFVGKKSKFKMAKISAAAAIVLLVAMVAVAVATIGGPLFMIGNLDFNLQDALGFTGTIGILEKQAEYVVDDEMARGEVPDKLAGKLAAHGLTVGQVASNGDFVRTNVYLADIDELKDVAVLGNFQTQATEEGQLAMLYDDKVIRAGEFVAAVESNPVMYAEFSAALEIGALYWYESSDVQSALSEAGVTRSLFANWVDKGDEEENEKQFREIIEGGIDGSSDVEVGGWDLYTTTTGEGDTEHTEEVTVDGAEKISGGDSGAGIVSGLASRIKDDSTEIATDKAAQLLNTAVSASEPWKAAKIFMMIEESIQQARIEGNGAVNYVMNLLNEETEVEYTDVTTGQTVKTKDSILTTPNFVAAVSAGKYSKSEAANFSRDGVLLAAKMSDGGIIQDTVVATDGQKQSRGVLKMGHSAEASADALSVVNDRIDVAMVQKNSDIVASIIGGNYALEGGANLSNMVNKKAVAAMGSDEETITAYHQEVKEVLARKAEAERATKSPFDISSPYTFMGSLARSLANVIVRNNASGNGGSVVATIASLTGESMKSTVGNVIADGKDDSYEMTHGEHCETVNGAAGVEGDIYCNAQTTISTGYMKRGKDDWEGMADDEEYKDFVTMGMDRAATMGVRSADVCNKYKDAHQSLLGSIVGFFEKMLDIYNACSGVPDDVANGASYSFSSGNGNSSRVKEMAGYALYDQVSSLLEDRKSKTAMIREDYYAKHPQDNSRAGKLARISGLTKAEIEIALAYADYLTVIANYDPAERFVFGEVEITRSENVLVEHANRVASELYVVWHGRTEYDDLRGRTRVA